MNTIVSAFYSPLSNGRVAVSHLAEQPRLLSSKSLQHTSPSFVAHISDSVGNILAGLAPIFPDRGLDLVKMESLSRNMPWSFRFVCEQDGHSSTWFV